ncbi:hypothetical protein N0B51_10250 [Tsuneonella sp. YG55]|uniref:Uncharacterized protein n=1 Tax=Tsuneonella litorea TaxID=2976475 RepID=A0A9X2W353_9SPHN|nr:hypothetical protein [Tsuneonella litorea]MCT2559359.1 hypothetical protein [Tsuneonella litorea]
MKPHLPDSGQLAIVLLVLIAIVPVGYWLLQIVRELIDRLL